MTTVILVGGTWSYRGDPSTNEWWWPTSPFATMLQGQGLAVAGLSPPERPFIWTTSEDGMFGGAADLMIDWRAGGENLYQYAVPSLCAGARIAPADLTIIAHSHGRQVVRFAAEAGLEIGHLVTVSSPIRTDVNTLTPHARARIVHWTHLYSDHSDLWQIGGEIGDAACLPSRVEPEADVNLCVPGVGHTGLLEDPKNFPLWQTHPLWYT
jgi:hypothetical protein